MLALVFLLLPLTHSAPPLNSLTPPPPCDTTHCRVSNQSLDSALSTFLCFTDEETSSMEEIDKKQELAAAIAPYLDSFHQEDLVEMDSESLVSLVNLVLHVGRDNVVKKTKQEHLNYLIHSVASADNFGLTENFFRKAEPIFLALLHCQSKTELVSSKAAEDRLGRFVADLVAQAQEQQGAQVAGLGAVGQAAQVPVFAKKGTGFWEWAQAAQAAQAAQVLKKQKELSESEELSETEESASTEAPYYFDLVGLVEKILDAIPLPGPEINWEDIATIMSDDENENRINEALNKGFNQENDDDFTNLAKQAIEKNKNN